MITFMEIPVPISNTEVKHKCAKNTSELPCWEDRYCQEFFFAFFYSKKHICLAINKKVCDFLLENIRLIVAKCPKI